MKVSELLWKESLNSDGKQLRQYQQRKFGLCVLNEFFNNISAISRLEALFVEETGVHSIATSHYQFLARNQSSCGNIE